MNTSTSVTGLTNNVDNCRQSVIGFFFNAFKWLRHSVTGHVDVFTTIQFIVFRSFFAASGTAYIVDKKGYRRKTYRVDSRRTTKFEKRFEINDMSVDTGPVTDVDEIHNPLILNESNR